MQPASARLAQVVARQPDDKYVKTPEPVDTGRTCRARRTKATASPRKSTPLNVHQHLIVPPLRAPAALSGYALTALMAVLQLLPVVRVRRVVHRTVDLTARVALQPQLDVRHRKIAQRADSVASVTILA